MAYFYRVVFFLSVALAGISSAFASFPAGVYRVTTSPALSTYSDTAANACAAWGPGAVATSLGSPVFDSSSVSGSTCTATGHTTVTCCGGTPPNTTITRTGSIASQPASCPAGSTMTGSTCTCNSGYVESGSPPNSCVPVVCPSGQDWEPLANTCMPTCTPPKVRSVGLGGVFNGCMIPAGTTAAKCDNAKGTQENYYSTPAPAATNTVCAALGPNAGCAVTVTYTASATTSNGIKTLYGIGVVSGKTCDQAKADNAAAVPPLLPPIDSNKTGAPAPTPCKPGTLPGEVNGVTVCMPSGTSTAPIDQSATTKTTNPDGSTTTKTTTTSCDGANCTTTTTSTTVPSTGGTGTTTTTKEDKPKESFCQENPNANICKNGSFSGSCTAGFSCEGDALQCSIAREQYSRNCQMFDKPTPESALYDTEKVKTGDQTAGLPGSSSVTLSPASFDQSAVFASQGLTDLQITVAGKVSTIEMSRLNQWLEILGYIGVAVTSLVCFRVVFGGTA